MKKSIHITLFLLLLNIGNSSQCLGDANLDDGINVQDIIVIVQHVLGLNFLEPDSFDNADVDYNNTINVLDIVEIVNIILE